MFLFLPEYKLFYYYVLFLLIGYEAMYQIDTVFKAVFTPEIVSCSFLLVYKKIRTDEKSDLETIWHNICVRMFLQS